MSFDCPSSRAGTPVWCNTILTISTRPVSAFRFPGIKSTTQAQNPEASGPVRLTVRHSEQSGDTEPIFRKLGQGQSHGFIRVRDNHDRLTQVPEHLWINLIEGFML